MAVLASRTGKLTFRLVPVSAQPHSNATSDGSPGDPASIHWLSMFCVINSTLTNVTGEIYFIIDSILSDGNMSSDIVMKIV